MQIPKFIEKSVKWYWKNIKYQVIKSNMKGYQFISHEETIRQIQDGKSLARFGDGEIRWIVGDNKRSFQTNSVELSNRLKEVLTSNNENLIVAIPEWICNENVFVDSSEEKRKMHIARYGKCWTKYADKTKQYADTHITRPYITAKDKSECKQLFELWKAVWANKDVIVVEGSATRFGIGNDLLDCAHSVQRILCPPMNAFDYYDSILAEACKQNSNALFLLAIGPTATILAYDLEKKGMHAIDIGHLDIEYEWFLRGSRKKEQIAGKFVNEAIPDKEKSKKISLDSFSEGEVKKYQSQILVEING